MTGSYFIQKVLLFEVLFKTVQFISHHKKEALDATNLDLKNI